MSSDTQKDRYFLVSMYYKTQSSLLMAGGQQAPKQVQMQNTCIKKPDNTMITWGDIMAYLKSTEPNLLPQTVVLMGLYEFKNKEEADIFFMQNLPEKILNEKTDS